MEGSLTKRKDGRWQGAVDIPNITGERKRKFVYAKTRVECRRKINEIIEQIESGNVLKTNKVIFREYAKIWLDTFCVNLSPTTYAGCKKSIYTYADKYIGDAVIAKVLPIHIQEMINDFSKTHAEKTCRMLLSDVGSVFKYAILNNYLKVNPCKGIVIPKDKERFQYYIYNEEEFNKLLDCIVGTKEEIPILLAALCGLRVSEIMGLTWNNINFKTHEISVKKACVHVNGDVMEKNTKTRNSYRNVIAPAFVIERLSLYKGIGYVYPKEDGTPENGGNYGKRFSRMLVNFGLPHTRFHDLRHFNATMMLKNGVSDKEAAARLGHSDTNMTKKYQHILAEMQSKPADILNTIVKLKKDVNLDVK